MEYLQILGVISILVFAFSAIMGTMIKVRQASYLISFVVFSILAFEDFTFVIAISIVFLGLFLPVIANMLQYFISRVLLKSIEKKHGKSGIDLSIKQSIKQSYSFLFDGI